jgi:hypothetical protein
VAFVNPFACVTFEGHEGIYDAIRFDASPATEAEDRQRISGLCQWISPPSITGAVPIATRTALFRIIELMHG